MGKADDNDSDDVYDAVEIREGLYRAARNAFTDVIEAKPPPWGGGVRGSSQRGSAHCCVG